MLGFGRFKRQLIKRGNVVLGVAATTLACNRNEAQLAQFADGRRDRVAVQSVGYEIFVGDQQVSIVLAVVAQVFQADAEQHPQRAQAEHAQRRTIEHWFGQHQEPVFVAAGLFRLPPFTCAPSHDGTRSVFALWVGYDLPECAYKVLPQESSLLRASASLLSLVN